MVITNKIKMDLSRKENLRTMDAVQGDAYTRNLEIHLYDNGEKWVIPDDVEVVIAYKSKTGNGAYSVLPDNKQAYEVIGNVVTVTIVPQAFAVAGDVFVSIVFLDTYEKQIATFGLKFNVHPNAAVGAGTPKDYFNLRQWVGAGPMFVEISSKNGEWVASYKFSEIQEANSSGRSVICLVSGGGGFHVQYLFAINKSVAVFENINAKRYYRTKIKPGTTTDTIEFDSGTLVRNADLSEEDFSIDADGIVSLKQSFALASDLSKYALLSSVRNPLYVEVTGSESGGYNSTHTFAQIKAARNEGRSVICIAGVSGGGYSVQPLVAINDTVAVFQMTTKNTYTRTSIKSDGTITCTQDKYALLSDLSKYALTSDLGNYALASDLSKYALSSSLRNPLYVEVTGSATTGYESTHTFDQIKAAKNEGRSVICIAGVSGGGYSVQPLVAINDTVAAFQMTTKNTYTRTTIKADGTITCSQDKYALSSDLGKYALASDLKDYVLISDLAAQKATDEKYFGITDDGLVYLKPEYRGACPSAAASSATHKYAVSDNGADKAGSKNRELPEDITIPDMIGETPVNMLAKGMFMVNTAVKRVKLPANITGIPNDCFYHAYNLEDISGTENVETIGSRAFSKTKIKKAIFPKLETMGKSSFEACVQLCVADIGNVTTIPNESFLECAYLHTIRNGSGVKTIGNYALMSTGKLKTPGFVSQLTSIGELGFLHSRASYDWAALTDCAFGTNATPLQFNPVDYWSGKQITACEIPILSTFDQSNPDWKGDEIVPGGLTWDEGCTICSCAHIYSAYEKKNLKTPAEFVSAALKPKPELASLPIGLKTTTIEYLKAVGYTVDAYKETGESYTVGNDLQYMYDALADGNFVILGVIKGSESLVVSHCVVIYGVNENGELLVLDSAGRDVGRAYIHPMPVQNITKSNCDFYVVKKN